MKNRYLLRLALVVFLPLLGISGCDSGGGSSEPVADSTIEVSSQPENTNTASSSNNQYPVAKLTASKTSGVAPLKVSVNARGSYDPDKDVIHYQWDLGDGFTQEGWGVDHRYETPGEYNIQLRVTDVHGNASIVQQTIVVTGSAQNQTTTANQVPVAKMTVSHVTAVAPANITVNAQGSYHPEGKDLTYQWSMGDGSNYNRWSVEHRYEQAGSYNVRLTVRDESGKSASTSKLVEITSSNNTPVATTTTTTPPPSVGSSSVDIVGNQHSPMGTNVASIRDWVNSQPFVDLFRSARSFESQSPGGITYDEKGWPKNLQGKVASTIIVTNLATNAIPTGNYTVLYDGDGEFDFNYGEIVENQPGRMVLKITDFNRSLQLRITRSNPSNYIRNIRFVMPGGICENNPVQRVSNENACSAGDYLDFESQHKDIIFNPDYLRFMQSFKVLRFMDFMDTNDSEVKNWSDMTRFDASSWGVGGDGKNGAPVEIMVELANRLNADPWFTLPHLANDDYARQFANYVRDNLEPGLKAYVEYSNEVWNGMFEQATYAKQRGTALNLDSNENEAWLKYYSKRSVEIFRIWENSFGGTNRLVRVLASQSASPAKSETILSFRDAYKDCDALAIAPYFGGDPTPFRSVSNVGALFTTLSSSSYKKSLQKVNENVQEQAEISASYQVDLIAYEGGQHLVDWTTGTDNQHPNPLFYQANRDTRMGDLYTTYLQNWKLAGGQLFVHYSAPHSWNKYGSWGLKEHLNDNSQMPKYQAVMRFIDNNPQWW